MVWTLFAVSALGSTGYIAAVTAGTLVAADIAGSAALGGPSDGDDDARHGLGGRAAVGPHASLGRRPGVLVGILGGTLGGVLALAAVLSASLPLLLVGSALIGSANAAGQLGRYVAADLVPAGAAREDDRDGRVGLHHRRRQRPEPGRSGGRARGVVRPAAAGRRLPAHRGLHRPGVVIAFVFLRPEPYDAGRPIRPGAASGRTEPSAIAALLRSPRCSSRCVTLAAGQVVMVLIMTMTPLHLTDHGHGLATVGIVLSAHTFGMFALSPITGRLVDRFGSPRIIAAGLATLAVAALIAALRRPTAARC